jgi:hypothetical protein
VLAQWVDPDSVVLPDGELDWRMVMLLVYTGFRVCKRGDAWG